MYAVVIDNKFTGVVYSDITDNVRDWCDEMDATLIKVDATPANIGTEDNPDYGSPTPEQLNQQRISEIKSELQRLDLQSERPMRTLKAAELQGLEPPEIEVNKLIALEQAAETLRQELATLQGDAE